MKDFLNAITAPTVWIVTIIELLLVIYLVLRYVKTKSLFVLITLLVTAGLFFDAFIISLGTFMSASNLPFTSRLRFVLHGVLVPTLFILAERAKPLKSPWNIVVYVITGICIVLGLVTAFLTKLEIANVGNVSRMIVDKVNTQKWVQKLPNMINIITVIPLIVVGIICWIKEKNMNLFLSGFFMLFFSAIGPIFKLFDYLFLLSMFGEVLMILFAILFEAKRTKIWLIKLK